MHDANLFVEHNQMQFYTWGDTDCCLPQGATEATLLGTYPNLQAGDVLIFQEMLGPQTGVAADADLRHRCAVRLTAVTTTDGQGLPLVDPLFERGTGEPIVSAAQQPTPVTEIQWSAKDALPFPVCISSTFRDRGGTADPDPGQRRLRQRRAGRPGPDDAGDWAAGRTRAHAVHPGRGGNDCNPGALRRCPSAMAAAGRGPGHPGRAAAAGRAPVTPTPVALLTHGASASPTRTASSR